MELNGENKERNGKEIVHGNTMVNAACAVMHCVDYAHCVPYGTH